KEGESNKVKSDDNNNFSDSEEEILDKLDSYNNNKEDIDNANMQIFTSYIEKDKKIHAALKKLDDYPTKSKPPSINSLAKDFDLSKATLHGPSQCS
ncbi:50_t:CDS:2, partial [Dentiscutata heterogama]